MKLVYECRITCGTMILCNTIQYPPPEIRRWHHQRLTLTQNRSTRPLSRCPMKDDMFQGVEKRLVCYRFRKSAPRRRGRASTLEYERLRAQALLVLVGRIESEMIGTDVGNPAPSCFRSDSGNGGRGSKSLHHQLYHTQQTRKCRENMSHADR
jgi:hypothetical protein